MIVGASARARFAIGCCIAAAVACGPPSPKASAIGAAPSASSSPAKASAPSTPPNWARGTVSEQLWALRVDDGTWARKRVLTWTKKYQVDMMRKSGRLLLFSEKTAASPTPFMEALSLAAIRTDDAGTLARKLSDAPFDMRRYAWSAAYATVLGLGGRRYGDQLVMIDLHDDSWIIELAPGREPPIRVRDLSQRDVELSVALAAPNRIAAAYHVRRGSVVPAQFREYVVLNERQIERWAVGTPDVHGEVDAEVELLSALQHALGAYRVPPPTDHALRPWDHVERGDALAELWTASLAFDIPKYALGDANLEEARMALLSYDRTQPPLEVRPGR